MTPLDSTLPALARAVAVAFDLAPERVTASATPHRDGYTIAVLVDGAAPSAEVQAFVDGVFDAARKLAAVAR